MWLGMWDCSLDGVECLGRGRAAFSDYILVFLPPCIYREAEIFSSN